VRDAQICRGRVAQLEEHLVNTQQVGGSIPSTPTANVSEWYAGSMTVNELITQLDLLPADADVIIRLVDSDEALTEVRLLDNGEVVLETSQTAT
jgi:hypothetical protein